MRKLKLYSSLFVVQINAIISSTIITWTSPMLPKLEGIEDNPLGRKITPLEMSFITTLNLFSGCIGSILYGILSSKFGRKTLLISMQFPCLFSFFMMAFARNIWLLYIGRFLIGFSFGGVLIMLPMYCCELAEFKNRGIVGALLNVCLNIGPLIPYCLGPFVSFFSFHIILATLTLIHLPFLCFFTIESPYFYITRDLEKARRIMKQIRNPNEVDKNLKEIQESIIKNKEKGKLGDILKSPVLRRTILIGLVMVAFYHLTGIYVFGAFTQTIFENADTFIDPQYSSIIIGVAQLVISVIFSPFTDSFPRKKLFVFSHLTIALTQIPLGLYYIFNDYGVDVSDFSFIPLVCLILFYIFINIGINSLILTYMGEIFPLKVKGIAISILLTQYSLCASFVTFSFNSLRYSLSIGYVFLIFAFCGFAASIFVNVFLIETKGKTLEQIQDEQNR